MTHSRYRPSQLHAWAQSAWENLELEPPADLARVSDKLGIRVVKQMLPADLSGVYVRTPSEVTITINNGMPPEHQRFVWAHEIGHHLLAHGSKCPITADLKRAGERNPIERQCDIFAVELLMPADKVREVAIELHHPEYHDKTRTIAARFGVSATAMRIRLRELGIASNEDRAV
jgi:Zn-dependent peptidase ImmA (M78 family)